MKTHSKKMPFCLYELGPFSSSFMLWPVHLFKAQTNTGGNGTGTGTQNLNRDTDGENTG